MDLKRIVPIIALAFALYACAGNPQSQTTQVPTQVADSPQATKVEPTAEATKEPEPQIAAPTPTPTAGLAEQAGADDSTSAEQPPQADLALPEYGVIATFHWLGLTTPTDITYNYEGWFNLLPDGTLQMVDETKGYAVGDAGMNLDGDCIEAVPVDIQYDFTIQGTHMEVPMSDVNPEVMMMYPDLVSGDNFKVFEIQFTNPKVTKIDIPPFANCWPDADQEFVNSLGTYWINVIPFISPEFRTVPADEGYTCPGVLSFNDEGLGSLEACYNIFLP
jgi:hypothetical protein